MSDFSDFYKILDSHNIDYVILRWFDNYPDITNSEDVDILVSNESYFRLKKLCIRGRENLFNFIKFDIYSVNNLDKHMSYYPPYLAKRILNSKIRHSSGYMVPDDYHLFLSLCFHALFHKGINSGLKSKYLNTNKSKHNFDIFLYDLSVKCRLNYSIDDFTIEGIHSILKAEDFLPPIDVYFRRYKKNSVIESLLPCLVSEADHFNAGVTVFILRDVINNDLFKSYLLNMFEKHNLSIISSLQLDDTLSRVFTNHTRGGDWGECSLNNNWGGKPSFVYVVKDYEIDSSIKEDFPVGHVCYNNIKEIKAEFRGIINNFTDKPLRCHVLHTSDNGVEAAQYLQLLK